MEKNEMMRTMSLQEQQDIKGCGALYIFINTIVDVLNVRIPVYV